MLLSAALELPLWNLTALHRNSSRVTSPEKGEGRKLLCQPELITEKREKPHSSKAEDVCVVYCEEPWEGGEFKVSPYVAHFSIRQYTVWHFPSSPNPFLLLPHDFISLCD